MKISCAWCKKIITFRCDHCAETLVPEIHGENTVLVCRNGLTPIVYTHTETMHTSMGMCADCKKLTHAERDQLAREGRGQQ